MPEPDSTPVTANPPAGSWPDPFAAEMSGPIQGFYINLDRSLDRRRSIEHQIAVRGLGHVYRRFAAVDGSRLGPIGRMTPGEIGIFHSHNNVLELARDGGKIVHVVEDDQLLSEFMMPAFLHILGHGLLDRYDMIFTDIGGIFDFNVTRHLKHRFDEIAAQRSRSDFVENLPLIDLAKMNFAGATSYLVTPTGIERLLSTYRRELASGPQMPVDLVIRGEVRAGRLRAATFFPFLTTSRIDAVGTTTSGRTMDDAALMRALLRHSFFIDRDLDGLAGRKVAEITARMAPRVGDRHHEYLVDIMSCLMSQKI